MVSNNPRGIYLIKDNAFLAITVSET